jgi:phosphoserine phosphatase
MIQLDHWNNGPAKRNIESFVARVTDVGSAEFIEAPARIAVFDNDGTLWTEKPLPIELSFILERLAVAARHDPGLRDRQPWKGALEGDTRWLSDLAVNHYHGDDRDLEVLAGAVMKTFSGVRVDTYERVAKDFLNRAQHPVLGRRFLDCSYAPMVSLVRYLGAHGFASYIASGGNRDFMRVFAEDLYGIPAERVIGSSNALRYTEDSDCGSVAYLAKPDVFDDGAVKPTRIWSRIGRRPALAFGNSNADLEMLQFAGGPLRPGLRLVLLHDDPEREFSYVSGSERVLDVAHSKSWTVVSMKDDWKTIFASARRQR